MKNGQKIEKRRPVVDLRDLNKITEPDVYPCPLQSDMIAALRGCHFITVMDATSFFYH